MKIRAVIIDDEFNNIQNLRILLGKYCDEVEVIGYASNGVEGIDLIRNKRPDLIFLDVEMPNMDGFQMLEHLNRENFAVIFITAYDQYAIKAIRFCAIDYLLKPIDINELKVAVENAGSRIREQQDIQKLNCFFHNSKMAGQELKLALPGSHSMDYIQLSEIIRCQAESNYTRFFLNNKSERIVAKTLKEYEELLNDLHFIRIHQSHLINMKYIDSIQGSKKKEIIMTNSEVLPVSRYRVREVNEKLRLFSRKPDQSH